MSLAPDEHQSDPSAWEPTASIVISGVTATAGAIGLAVAAWSMTGPRDGGLERLGEFVLMLAGMGGTLAAAAVGMIAAGVGLIRSKNRLVRTPPLKWTFAANLIEFALVFLLPSIMGRV
jgi:hypothetical protein